MQMQLVAYNRSSPFFYHGYYLHVVTIRGEQKSFVTRYHFSFMYARYKKECCVFHCSELIWNF